MNLPPLPAASVPRRHEATDRAAGVRRRLAAGILLVALLAPTACATREEGRRGPENHPAPPIPEMEARGTFFDGTIDVETVLNRAGFTGRRGAMPSDTAAMNGSESGGRMGRGGGGRGAGGRGGGRGGAASETVEAGGADSPAPRILPVNLPPVQFHLRLTNRGSLPVEIEVVDFNSDLGNFVVQPSTFLLSAGQSAEAEPMTSTLGVGSSQIPLTVTLRLNDRTEKQVLLLHPIAQATAPAAAAP